VAVVTEPTQTASEERERYRGPLGAYAAIASTYAAAGITFVAAAERTGHRIPERVPVGDLALLGVATHKLSRLLARDAVTGFLRAPFTEFQGSAGHGEVEERPKGHGPRLALGTLVSCPFCIGQWVAGGFLAGYVLSPRLTRWVAALFAVHAASDALQLAYRAAEDRV
jgi:hypothetical protein